MPLREQRSVLARYEDDTPIEPFRRYYLTRIIHKNQTNSI
jgi:hypothetical protein